jgi:nicotinamide-nucleotide amidase
MNILATQVGAALKLHGFKLVTAESCTGGGVASAITEIAGSSAWFERGYVTYSNLSKRQLLGVSEATLEQYGAVSEATVREMVTGSLVHSEAQVALAVSGIAGPDGGTPDKPVGTVWFAWEVRQGGTIVACHHFQGDRAVVRYQAVRVALHGVLSLFDHTSVLA